MEYQEDLDWLELFLHCSDVATEFVATSFWPKAKKMLQRISVATSVINATFEPLCCRSVLNITTFAGSPAPVATTTLFYCVLCQFRYYNGQYTPPFEGLKKCSNKMKNVATKYHCSNKIKNFFNPEINVATKFKFQNS